MNVPKLRFREFNDIWKESKLGDFTNVLMCKRIFANQTSESYEVPFYKIGTIGGTPDTFISRELFEEYKSKYNYPRTGEILITCSGTVGKCIIFNGEDSYFQDSNIVWLDNPNNVVNNNFLYYVLSNVDWSRLNSTTIVRIYGDNLRQIKIKYPTEKEQIKIINTLSLLDKKIELQSKKIEDLKLFKSSQIINFFNKNNFAEVNIKNIGFFQSGNSLSKDCLTSSGVPIILYGDLYTKYNEVIKKVEQYTNDNKKYVKSKQNQIIFPTSTTVNSLSLISPSSINLDGIIYGGDILILNLNKDVNADFLSYEINHYKKKEFSKIAQGSTIIHIHAEDLLNCKIALPNIVLQDKFALTFNKLNQKIELENNKLNKLQKLKKGLMQSMFV